MDRGNGHLGRGGQEMDRLLEGVAGRHEGGDRLGGGAEGSQHVEIGTSAEAVAGTVEDDGVGLCFPARPAHRHQQRFERWLVEGVALVRAVEFDLSETTVDGVPDKLCHGPSVLVAMVAQMLLGPREHANTR